MAKKYVKTVVNEETGNTYERPMTRAEVKLEKQMEKAKAKAEKEAKKQAALEAKAIKKQKRKELMDTTLPNGMTYRQSLQLTALSQIGQLFVGTATIAGAVVTATSAIQAAQINQNLTANTTPQVPTTPEGA